MSETLGTQVEDSTGEHWTDELDELPPRPRRKLLTPLTGVLLAVLIAACGFIGGVLVEKGQNSSSPSGNFAAAAARLGGAAAAGGNRQAASGRAGGAGGNGVQGLFGGQGGGNVTAGQVTSVEGRTLYVSTAQGNTVRVKVPVGESVSRTITTSVHAIHPGDSVIVQGASGKGGVIDASSVRATQASSSGSSGSSVLNQLFGGGSGGGSSASSGGNPDAGKGGAVNGLFGPGG
ncbi:MAG TPA: hypothetical protein VGI67_02880 [Thermoleophilaceae bacterium]|jgi:hypothetical protein